MHVYLVDQAAFEAVDASIRYIESCAALSDIKAKILEVIHWRG